MNKQKIIDYCASSKKGKTKEDIAKKFKLSKGKTSALLSELKQDGILVKKNGVYQCTENLGLIACKLVRLSGKFGFARRLDNETDIFIPGRFLMGAMPDDTLLVKIYGSEGRSPDGRVEKIIKEGKGNFIGTFVRKYYGDFVFLDSAMTVSIKIAERGSLDAKDGDKVMASVVKRATKHMDHRAVIVKVYGSKNKASVCCESVIDAAELPREFSTQVLDEAYHVATKEIDSGEISKRLDLRNEVVFTIDSAESKDLDDAISVKKLENGEFELGVHIADVSHYVKFNSMLDECAYTRGTSVYYANKVIPMLPESLSNGICSLNEGEDRLTFSAIIKFDCDGNIRDFSFKKSIIHSAVKGVYSEINSLLSGDADDELKQKYQRVIPLLPDMYELFKLRLKLRHRRGCPEIESSEAKFVIDDDGYVKDIIPRDRGESEMLIEEFMLCANECAAKFARQNEIPFVYRVHDEPEPKKIEMLREVLLACSIDTRNIRPKLAPKDLADLLLQVKDTPYHKTIGYQVLRSMAKAEYSEKPKGHFGLVLRDYAHFTSPIRRYPDLIIHRILSDTVSGIEHGKLLTRYKNRVKEASRQSTNSEQRAVSAERDCDDIYKAEYMQDKIGQHFTGLVSSIAPHGIYVELENTVEGLVRIDDPILRENSFNVCYRDVSKGIAYNVGDKVTVKLTGVDVAAGQVDFEFV